MGLKSKPLTVFFCNIFLSPCQVVCKMMQNAIFRASYTTTSSISTSKTAKHIKHDEKLIYETSFSMSWLSRSGILCATAPTSHWVLACSCKICGQPRTIQARTPFSIETGSCEPSASEHHHLNGKAWGISISILTSKCRESNHCNQSEQSNITHG